MAEKASSQGRVALLPEVINYLDETSVIQCTNPMGTSASAVENVRGRQPRKSRTSSMKLEFMRASTVLQRNFAGLFSSVQAPVSRQSSPISRVQSFARQHTRSLHIESKAETELTELFKRVQWPTTSQEERVLVESVRTVIWEGQNGGMLHGV